MQIRAEQLHRHLQAGDLKDIYLVSGDEQLLVDEACDEIVAAATGLGYDERTIFEAVPRAAWDELFADAGNLSLFATKRLLDVRIPPRGLDRAGSDAIRGYLDTPLADTLVLCRAPGLDWRQRSNAWYRAIDKAGVAIQVWPIGGRELPRWLEGRCRREGLELDRDALDALAERVEGNLLAAAQEIEKLKLQHGQGRIGADDIEGGVGDAAHFDTFELIDAAFAGRAARVHRMLDTLRQEGVAVFMVIVSLANQLQRARETRRGGQSPDSAPPAPRAGGRRQTLGTRRDRRPAERVRPARPPVEGHVARRRLAVAGTRAACRGRRRPAEIVGGSGPATGVNINGISEGN